jgi:predicted porin
VQARFAKNIVRIFSVRYGCAAAVFAGGCCIGATENGVFCLVEGNFFAQGSPVWCNNPQLPHQEVGALGGNRLVTKSDKTATCLQQTLEYQMKKSLIALAAVAASGAAFAQSSVTLFGIVDTGIGYVSNANAAGDNKYGVYNSGNSTSRLGFRGTEDLGNGLKAGFWLEGEIFADNGGSGLDFKRRSTLQLEGGFGELRIGRDQVAGYNKPSSYDVFGQTGIGQFMGWSDWSASAVTAAAGELTALGYDSVTSSITADASGVRSDNLISYYTPNFSGFKAGVSYGFDEKTSGQYKSGQYFGGHIAYDNGPLSVTFGADQRKLTGAFVATDSTAVLPDAAVSLNAKKQMMTLGASYNFGVVKLSGLLQQVKYKYEAGNSDKFNNYAVGVSAPVGAAGVVKAQYALYDQKALDTKAHQFSVGYDHNLSKRTAVYGIVSFLKNKEGSNMALSAKGLNTAGPGAGENQTGVQVGIRHAF